MSKSFHVLASFSEEDYSINKLPGKEVEKNEKSLIRIESLLKEARVFMTENKKLRERESGRSPVKTNLIIWKDNLFVENAISIREKRFAADSIDLSKEIDQR